MGILRQTISVLVLVAGVPDAGPTLGRSSEVVFWRRVRRLLAVEVRVLVAGDARRFSGRDSLVEFDEGVPQLNGFPVAIDEQGLHSCEEVIVKCRIQVRGCHRLTQLSTLLCGLSLSVGLGRRGSPW